MTKRARHSAVGALVRTRSAIAAARPIRRAGSAGRGPIEGARRKGSTGSAAAWASRSRARVACSACREQRAHEREANLPQRERLRAFTRTEHSLGLRPPAEPEQALGRERVDVAAEAPIEPGQPRVNRRVEHLIDRHLVRPASRRATPRYSTASSLRLRVRRGRDCLATELHAAARFSPVIDDDAEHPCRHHPGRGIGSGPGQQLEHALGSRFGDVIATEHELGLSKTGEHTCRLRPRVAGQQGRGRGERSALSSMRPAPHRYGRAARVPTRRPAPGRRTGRLLGRAPRPARCRPRRSPARRPAKGGRRDSPPHSPRRRSPRARGRARVDAARPPVPRSRPRPRPRSSAANAAGVITGPVEVKGQLAGVDPHGRARPALVS